MFWTLAYQRLRHPVGPSASRSYLKNHSVFLGPALQNGAIVGSAGKGRFVPPPTRPMQNPRPSAHASGIPARSMSATAMLRTPVDEVTSRSTHRNG